MIKPLLTALALLIPAPLAAEPLRYALDPANSEVGFIFTLNNAAAKGRMPVKFAEIEIDFDALQRSSVDVTVDVREARTGLIFATEALKAPSVLDARSHGTIRFVSSAVRLNGQGRLSDGARIDGLLTIKGITRPVTLAAALYRQSGTQAGDLSRLSFRLTGSLSRSAFGASGYGNLVDDTVGLNIVARVNR